MGRSIKNEKPNIAYIFTLIEFGGAEKVNLTFLETVDRNQFNIYPVLLIRPWEEENRFIQKINKLYHTFYIIPVALKPENKGRDYFRIIRSIWYLYQISSKKSIHLIHSHGYFADIIAAPICKLRRIPHISTCHGFISNDRKLRIYNAFDIFILRFCNRIIAVSEKIKEDLLNAKIVESKIKVILNAVQNSYNKEDLEKHRMEKRQLTSIDQDEFVIGYVGRLSEEKGVHYLIDAAAILKERGETFRMIIIGDGPKRKYLENSVREKGLEKEIIFTGFQNNSDEWYPMLDIFVLPSLTEGTPMALLEAMAAGVPPIASAVGGVPRVVEDGVNGFLVAPGDIQSLSEKIIFLKENPILRNKMGFEAANLIKNKFDAYQWCRKIEEQYELLLQKDKR